MSSERFRRKDLKHDEFVTTTSEITRWLMERRRRIGWGLLAIVVLISIVAMVQVYQQRQETSASALLAVAMEVYLTPLAEEAAAATETTPAAVDNTDNGSEATAEPTAADAAEEEAGDSGELPDPAVDAAPDTPEAAADAATGAAPAAEQSAIGHRQFTTEAARYEAAREEFAPIVRRYGNTPSGRVASFYLGLCESSLGNDEAAAEALQQAAGASQEIIATVSLYRLGQLQMAEGELEEAIASFDLLLNRNSDAFPDDEALMSKARAQEAAGDQLGAMLTYQRVVDDYADSFSAADARTRVEELAVELGLDPNVERL